MEKDSFMWVRFPEFLNVFGHDKVHEPISNTESPAQHDLWGCVEYPDGTMYEGWLLQGSPNDLGICYYSSGDIFVGFFSKGSINGEGTVFFQSGDFFSGEFCDGSIYRGLYGRNGCEGWGVWERGRCIEESCVAVPEGFQQRHSSLFSAILYRVHHHFSNYRTHLLQHRRVIRPDPNAKTPQKILPVTHSSDHCLAWATPPTRVGGPLIYLNAHNECGKGVLDSGTLRSVVPNITVGSASKSLFLRPAGEQDAENRCEDDKDIRISCARKQSLPPNVIFACSAPVCNEYFSSRRCQLHCFVFLFPFLSFHWSPFAPLQVSTVDQEREFVVSGATLRQDFDSMNLTINCIAVAVCFLIAAIIIVVCKASIGHSSLNHVTFMDIISPCILWFVLAMFCAGYNSYFRYPHFLERMDRQLTPKLSAFAANMVDARARVCINTFDEEGRGKVTNHHYLYRWVFFSVLSGIIFSLAAPITRAAYGQPPFGSGLSICALVLFSLSIFLFMTTLMYYVFKITDIQREIAAKLRVLSDLAYIEKRGIIRPSVYLRQTFDMGARLNTSDLFNGFTGWYATRSLTLYGSIYSNHLSRSAAMSIFATVILITSIFQIVDAVSVFFSYHEGSSERNVITHSYGILVFLIWGFQLIRYINASAYIKSELKHHQYIMNLTSMYHRVKYRDMEASEIIKSCCDMATSHDLEPHWFNFPMYPISMSFLVLLNLIALSSSILILILEVRR